MPQQRAAIEFTLARALWSSEGERARARSLASHALSLVRAIDGTHPAETARIERWVANHAMHAN
jgi:hypothetical protein